jgi:hypothetical protein
MSWEIGLGGGILWCFLRIQMASRVKVLTLAGDEQGSRFTSYIAQASSPVLLSTMAKSVQDCRVALLLLSVEATSSLLTIESLGTCISDEHRRDACTAWRNTVLHKSCAFGGSFEV